MSCLSSLRKVRSVKILIDNDDLNVSFLVGIALLIVILFGLVMALIYYTKEFIEGISEVDDSNMFN